MTTPISARLSRMGPFGLAFVLWGFIAAPALAQRSTPLIPGGNARAPISIDAGKLDYYDKEQKLVYSGGVLAKQGDATLKAPELVIFMAREGGESAGERRAGAGGSPLGADSQVRRMEASGPVVITSKDQVGTGDRGIYDRAENKVYLIGNPVLTEASHVVRGDAQSRLIYDLATGRAHITGGRVQSLITPSQPSSAAGAGNSGGGRPIAPGAGAR
jgi:lipopolysaccharide export system protein LptA